MLNVDLLQRARISILDPQKPFSMSCWNTCIAGHVLRAAGESERWIMERVARSESVAIMTRAADYLEMHTVEVMPLFIIYTPAFADDRECAVARLDRFIEDYAPKGSALEPRSRSARAENHVEEVHVAEEPELVGA